MLPPGLRVREARPDDAEALHALYHAAYRVHALNVADATSGPQHAAADPHRPPVAALKDTLDDVRASIRDSLVLVAEDADGRLVASIATRRIANLRRLAVAPDRKGEGLGGALLDEATRRAQAEGFEVAMLDTFATHPWLPAFYERHGFEPRCVEEFPDGTRWRQFRKRLGPGPAGPPRKD